MRYYGVADVACQASSSSSGGLRIKFNFKSLMHVQLAPAHMSAR